MTTTPLSGPQLPRGIVPVTLLAVCCDAEGTPTVTPLKKSLRYTPGAFAMLRAKLAELAPQQSPPWAVPMVRVLAVGIAGARELLNEGCPADDPTLAALDTLHGQALALADQMAAENQIPTIDLITVQVWAGLLWSPQQAMEYDDVAAMIDPYAVADLAPAIMQAMGMATGGAEKKADGGAVPGTTPAT
jgi:hypothetical protein